MALTPAQFTQGFYVAYWGRGADPAGIDYWTDLYPDSLDLAGIAENFALSPEAAEQFAYFQKYQDDEEITQADLEAFVIQIYANLFDKDPADDAGDPEIEGDTALSYWVRILETGASTPGAFIANIMNAAMVGEGDDAAMLQAKIAVADAMTEQAAALGWTDEDEIIAWLRSDDAKSFIEQTTAENVDDQIAAAQGAVPEYVAPPVPGETYTLTVGEDDFTGTNGNDIFNARLVEGGAGTDRMTLQNFDVIDGGAGTDRLNASLTSEVAPVAPTLTSVENIWLRSATDVGVMDFINVTGAEQIWNDRSTKDLIVFNVSNPVAVGLNQVSGFTTYEVEYLDGASGGSQTVVLQGAGKAEAPVFLNVIDNDGIEELSVVAAAGFNNIEVGASLEDIESLNISGSAQVILTESTSNFQEIKSVDASAYTGNLDLDITGADLQNNKTTVVLGSGDDRLAVDATTFGKDVSIDLGGGFNTLALAGIVDDVDINNLKFDGITGVNNLEFIDAISLGADATLGLKALDDLSELTFNDDVDLNGWDLTIANAPAQLTLNLEGELYGGAVFFDGVEQLVINSADYIGDAGTVTILGESLTSLTLNAEDDVYIELVDLFDLTTLDLSGTGEGVFLEIDADFADFGQAVTILIGESDLDYYADTTGNLREVFRFVGEDIGTIEIYDFLAGVGGNADRLDFSAFDGVSSLDDLNITFGGGNTLITSAAFDGEIMVAGVDLSTDAVNFVFAEIA